MGQERGYFFLIRMSERHNRRTIGDKILALNPAKLRELAAAYAIGVPAGTSDDGIKQLLTNTLIAGEKPYDLDALDRHRAEVAAAAAAVAAAVAAAAAAGVP